MKRLLLVILLTVLVINTYAQDTDNLLNFQQGRSTTSAFSDRPAQYILGSGDILLVTVNLWGHVQRPGIYSVPSSYTLIDLISSAGGPLKTARLNDVRVVRKNTDVVQIDVDRFLKTVVLSSWRSSELFLVFARSTAELRASERSCFNRLP